MHNYGAGGTDPQLNEMGILRTFSTLGRVPEPAGDVVIVLQGDTATYIERLRQAPAVLARPEPHLCPAWEAHR